MRAKLLSGPCRLLAGVTERMNGAIGAHLRRLGNMPGGQDMTWCDQIPAAAALAVLQNFEDAAGFHPKNLPCDSLYQRRSSVCSADRVCSPWSRRAIASFAC